MKLTLKIWRQPRGAQQGKLVEYQIDNISEDTSFLEMLDQLNEELTAAGQLFAPDAYADHAFDFFLRQTAAL